MIKKFSLKKTLNFIAILLVMISSIIYHSFDEPITTTQKELTNFYQIELQNAIINNVYRVNSELRGGHSVFTIDSSIEHFPILLENITSEDLNRFVKGTLISKNPNSYKILIDDGKSQTVYKIRPAEYFNDKNFHIIFSIIFFGIPLIAMIFIPNSFWEKKAIFKK